MSYEDSKACRFVAQSCVICGKPLVDSDSLEAGMGPTCRERYGYDVMQADPAEAITPVQEPVVDARVSKLFTAGFYRKASNTLIHFIASGLASSDQSIRACWAIRDLGYHQLYARLVKKAIRINIIPGEGKLKVRCPYDSWFISDSQHIPGRRWDRVGKYTEFDDTPQIRRDLVAILQRRFPSDYIYAGERVIFPTGEVLGKPLPRVKESPKDEKQRRRPKDRSLLLADDGKTIQLRTRRYDEVVVKGIRDIRPRTWNNTPTDKYHSFPMNPEVVGTIIESVPELWVDPEIVRRVEEARERLETGEKLSKVKGSGDVLEAIDPRLLARIQRNVPPGEELYPFQIAGVAFVETAGGRALIADEMGLGKTVQALSWVSIHPEVKRVLVVCPVIARSNWKRHILRWIPSAVDDGVELITSKDRFRGDSRFVVINYDILERFRDQLKSWSPDSVIIDESHYIKNQKAKRTKAMISVANGSENVILLTGTPILNRPVELFTSLNLVAPEAFPKFTDYAFTFCDPVRNGRYGWKFEGISNRDRLVRELAPVVIRRRKREVLDDLPDKRRDTYFVQVETDSYKKLEAEVAERLEKLLGDPKSTSEEVLAEITRLRKETGVLKVQPAIEWAMSFLESTDRKLVVFTHHRGVASGIADSLKSGGYKVGMIDGSIAKDKRYEIVDGFQNGDVRVIVGTIGAMGTSIDLTSASEALMVEREWTPAAEDQAEDRLYRIGQENNVSITYLTAEGTIDEDLGATINEKRELIRSVVDSPSDKSMGAISREVVNKLLNRVRRNG